MPKPPLDEVLLPPLRLLPEHRDRLVLNYMEFSPVPSDEERSIVETWVRRLYGDDVETHYSEHPDGIAVYYAMANHSAGDHVDRSPDTIASR